VRVRGEVAIRSTSRWRWGIRGARAVAWVLPRGVRGASGTVGWRLLAEFEGVWVWGWIGEGVGLSYCSSRR